MTNAIGIDLGTTYTCVAYMKTKGQVEVATNHHGNRTTPSVVYFGSTLTKVGEQAVEMRGEHSANAIFQVKRFMGRLADDNELKKREYPFEVIASSKGVANFRINHVDSGKSVVYTPEQVSSYIIRYAKALAEESIEDKVTEAVITVPANFTNAQRQATKDAGELAGLKVLRIVNEPTAAALAYGFNKKRSGVILVYDLGGGTFDVSIVRMNGTEAEVLSTQGLTFLGGEDFDYRIYEEAVSQFKKMGVDVPEARKFALHRNCELAKRTLSTCEKTEIETFDASGEKKTFTITRETFEVLCQDLFEKTIDCVKDAIKESRCPVNSIDDVVLVGGSSRIPRVQELLLKLFIGKKLKFDIPPDHAVAHGAAILAESISGMEKAPPGGEIKLVDVTPFTLGIGVLHDNLAVLIKRNTRYPTEVVEYFMNAEENQTSLIFKIYEGEMAIASRNNLLGKLEIACAPKPIGVNDMEATFSIDANGILQLRVKDSDTGEEAQITLEMSKLSFEEKQKMKAAANEKEEEEAIQKTKREARSAFTEALLRLKESIPKFAGAGKQDELRNIAEREEAWFLKEEDPSNEELRTHAKNIRQAIFR